MHYLVAEEVMENEKKTAGILSPALVVSFLFVYLYVYVCLLMLCLVAGKMKEREKEVVFVV